MFHFRTKQYDVYSNVHLDRCRAGRDADLEKGFKSKYIIFCFKFCLQVKQGVKGLNLFFIKYYHPWGQPFSFGYSDQIFEFCPLKLSHFAFSENSSRQGYILHYSYKIGSRWISYHYLTELRHLFFHGYFPFCKVNMLSFIIQMAQSQFLADCFSIGKKMFKSLQMEYH